MDKRFLFTALFLLLDILLSGALAQKLTESEPDGDEEGEDVLDKFETQARQEVGGTTLVRGQSLAQSTQIDLDPGPEFRTDSQQARVHPELDSERERRKFKEQTGKAPKEQAAVSDSSDNTNATSLLPWVTLYPINEESLAPVKDRVAVTVAGQTGIIRPPATTAHSAASLPMVQQGQIIETHHKMLDEARNVHLTWQVDFASDIIEFEVTAHTRGYIGFGLNLESSGMQAADIVIGGVHSNGSTFFADYHGTGNQMPVLDQHQSWRLLNGSRNETHTTLKFSRALDTCDPEDVPVTNDTMSVIWALGNGTSSDPISYHIANRGAAFVNLLDPPSPSLKSANASSFEFIIDMEMPAKEFTAWCAVRRPSAPVRVQEPFKGKVHIIGFKPPVQDPPSPKHDHRVVLFKCNGERAKLEKKALGKGEDCFESEDGDEDSAPMDALCPPPGREVLYVWGAGGEQLIFPEHVGIPMGFGLGLVQEKNYEYFMLQVFAENPGSRSAGENVTFRVGVEVLYTEKLREHEAAIMTIGHTPVPSLLIPPMTANWKLQGHCGGGCTKQLLPEKGIQLTNVLSHSHETGRQMKLRHFRGNEELPWISSDSHYNFSYQQSRPIRNERTVLPGDQLTIECTYNSVGRPNATIGGLTSAHEMCEAFLWYYPAISKVHSFSCRSFVPPESVFSKFGITKAKQGEDGLVVQEPDIFAGMTFTDVLNTAVAWNETMIKDLQSALLTVPQISLCPATPSPTPTIGRVLGSSPPAGPPKPTLVGVPFLHRLYQPAPSCTVPKAPQEPQDVLYYGGSTKMNLETVVPEDTMEANAEVATMAPVTTTMPPKEPTSSTATPSSIAEETTTTTTTESTSTTEEMEMNPVQSPSSTEATSAIGDTTSTTTMPEEATPATPDESTDAEVQTSTTVETTTARVHGPRRRNRTRLHKPKSGSQSGAAVNVQILLLSCLIVSFISA